MSSLPLWALLGLFVVAGVVVWFAGTQLSKTTDVLDARFGLGSALGGLIVLAIATNLPELAITVSAALSGDISVAVGNILGGIALQTVVLVVLDRFGKHGGHGRDARPLTYRAASLTLVVEALVVVAVLAAVVAGSQLPASLTFARLTPGVVLVTVLWFVGLVLVLVRRAGHHLPWHEDGRAPDTSSSGSGRRKHGREGDSRPSTARAGILFAIAALLPLAAGVVLERAGDAAASRVGLGGVLFGATVLALATSLPEISTGLQSIRQGDDDLAVSDIFGGNAFLPVLFLLAALLSGKAVLPQANASDIYLTALAALLTLVYALGLLFRPTRRVLGMGVDSLMVLALYLVGVVGLVTLT